jgi:hypothetical protein
MKRDDPNGCDCCVILGFISWEGIYAWTTDTVPPWFDIGGVFTLLAGSTPYRGATTSGQLPPDKFLGFDVGHNSLICQFTHAETAHDAGIVRFELDKAGATSAWTLLRTQTSLATLLAGHTSTTTSLDVTVSPTPVTTTSTVHFNFISYYEGVLYGTLGNTDYPGTAGLMDNSPVWPMAPGGLDFGYGHTGWGGSDTNTAIINSGGSGDPPGPPGTVVQTVPRESGALVEQSSSSLGGWRFGVILDQLAQDYSEVITVYVEHAVYGGTAFAGSWDTIGILTGDHAVSFFENGSPSMDCTRITHPDFFEVGSYPYVEPPAYPPASSPQTYSATPSSNSYSLAWRSGSTTYFAIDYAPVSGWTRAHWSAPTDSIQSATVSHLCKAPNLGGVFFGVGVNGTVPTSRNPLQWSGLYFTSGGAATEILFDDPVQTGTLTITDPWQEYPHSGILEVDDPTTGDISYRLFLNLDASALTDITTAVATDVSVMVILNDSPSESVSVVQDITYGDQIVININLTGGHNTLADLLTLLTANHVKYRLMDSSAIPSLVLLRTITTTDSYNVFSLVAVVTSINLDITFYHRAIDPLTHADYGVFTVNIHDVSTAEVDFNYTTGVMDLYYALPVILSTWANGLTTATVGDATGFVSLAISAGQAASAPYNWITITETGSGSLAFAGVNPQNQFVNFICDDATSDTYILWARYTPMPAPGGGYTLIGNAISWMHETPGGDYTYVSSWKDLPNANLSTGWLYPHMGSYRFDIPFIAIPMQDTG